MPSFQPDSALVDRVLVSPNHDTRGRSIDMIVLHYTGMRFRTRRSTGCAIRRPGFRRITWCSKTARSFSWCRRANAPGTPASRPGPANRHQLALDRHRDLQSRPRFRLSGISGTRRSPRPSRCAATILTPQHRPPGKRRWRIPTWRRAASTTRAKNFPGSCWPIRHRPLGRAGRPSCQARAAEAQRPRREGHRAAERVLAEYGYGIDATGRYDVRPPTRSSPRSSAISGPPRSTASPTLRRSDLAEAAVARDASAARSRAAVPNMPVP